MDGFPEKLSALLSGVFDEVREELNEFKQSNITLLRKVESLERTLEIIEAQSEGFRLRLDEQEQLTAAAGTSLARLRDENKALKDGNDEILKQHNALIVKMRKDDSSQYLPPPPPPPSTAIEKKAAAEQAKTLQPAKHFFHRESSVVSSVTFHDFTPKAKRTTLLTKDPNASSSSGFFVDAVEPRETAGDHETLNAEVLGAVQPQDEVQDDQPPDVALFDKTQVTNNDEVTQPQKRKRMVSKDLARLPKTNAHLLKEPENGGRSSKRLKSSHKPPVEEGHQTDEGDAAGQSSGTTKDSLESNIVVKPRQQRKALKPLHPTVTDISEDIEEEIAKVNGELEAESSVEQTAKEVTKPAAALTRSPRSKLLSDFKSRPGKSQAASKAAEQNEDEAQEEDIAFPSKNSRPKRTSIKTQKAREGFPKV